MGSYKQEQDHTHTECSSGGLADEISRSFLTMKSGVVFGAVISEDGYVSHQRVSDPDDLIRIRGSKYARSDLSALFPQIQSDL